MMNGATPTLEPYETRIVAAWAQLKAICWDALQHDPKLPVRVAKNFAQSILPSHDVVMFIGAVNPKSILDVSLVRAAGPTRSADDGSVVMSGALVTPMRSFELHRTTIMFGHLALSVGFILSSAYPVEILLTQSSVSEVADRLWPWNLALPLSVIDRSGTTALNFRQWLPHLA